MVDLKDFFAASVGAAAALIGLLFVAITFAPEKIFGSKADAQKQGQASGAFIALANVFFVSLAALIPRFSTEVIIVIALVSIWQILQQGGMMSQRFSALRGRHRFGLISLGIYVLELYIAVRLRLKVAPADGFVYTVLGLYGYALGTSWALLGARDDGPR
ncbi:MAG: hypothetical protein ACLPYS_10130 [Vulcanimicrobiaceae bacterium]